jgi:hypothetical protein
MSTQKTNIIDLYKNKLPSANRQLQLKTNIKQLLNKQVVTPLNIINPLKTTSNTILIKLPSNLSPMHS